LTDETVHLVAQALCLIAILLVVLLMVSQWPAARVDAPEIDSRTGRVIHRCRACVRTREWLVCALWLLAASLLWRSC
jgi:hypothetical protein